MKRRSNLITLPPHRDCFAALAMTIPHLQTNRVLSYTRFPSTGATSDQFCLAGLYSAEEYEHQISQVVFLTLCVGGGPDQITKRTTRDWRLPLIHESRQRQHSQYQRRDIALVAYAPLSTLAKEAGHYSRDSLVRLQENGTLPKNQSVPKNVCNRRQLTLVRPTDQPPAQNPQSTFGVALRCVHRPQASDHRVRLLPHRFGRYDEPALAVRAESSV